MKPWYKSKTMLFNLAVVGGAAATGVVGVLPTLQSILGPHTYAIVFFSVSVVNIILRSVTTSAITTSKSKV